ncbi:hypothetical protein F7734_53500 [Scytonema sp. UIC 10036]|uniref:hypothetical protein n=1 Tax=Scytonema sp. UIC 10036 TaxID=2304196 RepID=UPI0012DA2F16|nr:hypothetical protein [Scytonema sp. UIC 10036]MUH00624.1 hypothetical protein [Scytonema sp. UIC 10036]
MAQQIPSVADGVLSEGETSIAIATDKERWQQWLEGVQSFRYVPDSEEAPYTARKEKSKKADGDYWYAYRKVQGKLHKRYIGRASDLTVARLEEVASLLSVPAEPRAKPEVTEQASVTQSDEVARLQNELGRLQNDNQQLQNELHNKQQKAIVHIDYQAARDRILASLKLGKQAPKYKASKALLDQFIAELPASTSTSTPDTERIVEWIDYAIEDLKLGDVQNGLRSLLQALAVAKGERETTPNHQETK